ncbi:MAG: hypothetical protein HKO59_02705 [Phycisphaerales bacterium]|nr:hypothetical protein [Phycisphaerales bacterium]NNM24892.1 hypothetical protein [Phycisphaerales bacterium]
MKKATVGFCTVVAFGGIAGFAYGGGTTLLSENFDSYADGSCIVDAAGWDGWDGSPCSTFGQGLVSSAFSQSAPHSLEIDAVPSDDDIIHLYTGIVDPAVGGVFDYTTSLYAPASGTGAPFFILMNNYNDGGGKGSSGTKSWSTQIGMDMDTDTATADFSGETIAIPEDEWYEVRVRINLDVGDEVADIDGAMVPEGRQEVFLNGAPFYSGPWLGQVSGASFRRDLQAADLYANTGGPIYYDDISISTVPPNGACCVPDGSCFIADDEAACLGAGNVFGGIGSSCELTDCFAQDGDGAWGLTAALVDSAAASSDGFSWGGGFPTSTCGLGSSCDLSSSDDISFALEVTESAEYEISICTADFDTVLHVGTSFCSNDIAEEDDSTGCGTASRFRGNLDPGTVYITVEGFGGGSCGVFNLTVRKLCPELPAPGGKTYIEAEACGDDDNGGCNMAVPAFEPLLCDSVNRGTAWTDGATRDTDWWELLVDATTSITMTGISERAATVFGIINSAGSGDCADATAVAPAVAIAPCFEDEPAVVTADLDPGTWWFFVATEFGSPVAIDCGDLDAYEFSLVCGDSCVAAPDGDLTGDGFTDFSDLLEVLANFGGSGPAGDTDCNGAVEFTDLLTVIANWNPAP